MLLALLSNGKYIYCASRPLERLLTWKRDSDASAPPEFPPEQPDADVEADGDQYGIEEEEDEDEDEDAETVVADPNAMVEDSEKATAASVDEEEETGDESEDLEGESSGSEGEEGDEDEAEELEGDDAMEVDGAVSAPVANSHQAGEVMAH